MEKKAGYVNASASPRIYSIARYWELQGWKCALPGAIWLDTYKDRDEFSVSSWVALPTIQEVKNHIPVDLIIRELASWWKIAPQDIRDDLEASRFHLSSKVRRHLLDNHQLVPHVPLEGAAAGPSPLVVDWALAEIRTAFYQEKANKRALKRQQLEAIALEKVRSGMSYAAVARSLGVSPTTISSIAKRHGIKSTGNPIDAPRVVERCREALSLRLSGMSVAEVGRTIGVSSRTAEKLLQDARFYDTPHKYPGRLRLAESHIRGELGDDMEASNNQKRRAHRDAAVLTYLRLG